MQNAMKQCWVDLFYHSHKIIMGWDNDAATCTSLRALPLPFHALPHLLMQIQGHNCVPISYEKASKIHL